MKKFFALLLVALLVLPFAVSCSKVDFAISFIVDGEEYATVNTNGQEVVRMPENPKKNGYVFKGWFWDEGVWEKPFTANSLFDAPLSSDMKVYAYFANPFSEDFEEEGDTAVDFVKRDDGEEVAIVDLKQTAIKNEDFLDTEVSWYDDEYNYYVFNVGKILNVPLTTTYAIFTYDSGKPTFSSSVTKTTQESLKISTSTAITNSFTVSGSLGISLSAGVTVGKKDVVQANVQRGFTAAVSGSYTNTDMWSSTYEECITRSTQETDTVGFTFDSSCRKGNYLYLYLGNVNVYYAVIQSRTDPSVCYYETFDSITAHRYALVYVGEGDDYDFPIDKKEKIEVNTSFIADLIPPTQYIEGQKPEQSYDPIVNSAYSGQPATLNAYYGHYWMMEIDDAEKYYSQGYDKIKIEFEYFANGEWVVVVGCPSVTTYICAVDDRDNNFYKETVKTQNGGTTLTGEVVTDLRWFKDSGKIYMIVQNESLVSSISIDRIKIKYTIYKEDME